MQSKSDACASGISFKAGGCAAARLKCWKPRAIMMPFKKYLLATTMVLSGCSEGPATSTQLDPYLVLPGAWGWEGTSDCTVSSQRIHFSADRKQMVLSLTPKDEHGTREHRREVTYQILRDLPGGLRMSMDGEKRLDPTGKPVTWDLMLVGSDEYCWHRSDWPGTGCTKSMDRCEAGK